MRQVFLFLLLFRLVRFVFSLIFSVLGFVLRGLVSGSTARLLGYAHVIDGDTVVFAAEDQKPLRVRLYGLDAPESSQMGGEEATAFLRNALGHGPLILRIKDTDKYGRVVGVLETPDGVDINHAMVAHGYARAYTAFSRAYVAAERKAKATNAGLWSTGALDVHPSAYRKARMNRGGRQRDGRAPR